MVLFRRSFGLILIGVALLAGCVTYPQNRVFPAQYPAESRARVERNVAVFETVWDLVNRKHYEPKTHGIDWEQEAARYEPRAAAATDDLTLYATINEMLAELKDSHTRALRPNQANVRHSHQRTRTGFSMTRIEKKWVVTDVLPDSPAAVAGVEPGWIVTARNGEPLGDRPDFWPKEGESARWEFLDHRDLPVTLTLNATRLSTAPLQIVRVLPGGFVYLRFDEFDTVDRRWLGRQLRAHRAAPGVVIDLRRNPGGETFSLGITIGEFFDHAVDCGTFVTRAGARNVKNSWQFGSAHYHGRVVVLVDNASASAAEIFSAVLKDHNRATIVGRPTAGAVLASWFYHLPDGGELQLSREDYIAPNGRRIEGNGVEPNIVVTRTLADIRAGRDPDLDTALQVLNAAK
jgi:carboxyl-terminal processing protease